MALSNQEKIAWLRRYGNIDREIDRQLEQKARWRARAEKMTPSTAGLPAGGTDGDATQSAIEKICEIEEKINADIDRLLDVKAETERTIRSVPDDRLQEVLRRRYIDGNTWEKIADELHYSCRWVYTLHSRGLAQLFIEVHVANVI